MIVRYPNGYTASIIDDPKGYSDDDCEVAVMDHNGRILYDTPIVSDVLRLSRRTNLSTVLARIAALPNREV